LNALDDRNYAIHEPSAAVPVVEAGLCLLLDKIKVDDLVELVGPLKVGDAVADLTQHVQHTRIARGSKLKIVDQAFPKCSLEHIARVV